VFYIPLAYTTPAWRDGSAAACRRAGCDRNHVARRHTPASDLWFRSALARFRLAMPAILKSERAFSDLSLLARSQLWATRLLTVVHAALRTGRPIVDAGTVVVMRIHSGR
jgi:hypothetical protein